MSLLRRNVERTPYCQSTPTALCRRDIAYPNYPPSSEIAGAEGVVYLLFFFTLTEAVQMSEGAQRLCVLVVMHVAKRLDALRLYAQRHP